MCKGRSKRFQIPRRPYDVAKKKKIQLIWMNIINLEMYLRIKKYRVVSRINDIGLSIDNLNFYKLSPVSRGISFFDFMRNKI